VGLTKITRIAIITEAEDVEKEGPAEDITVTEGVHTIVAESDT